MADKPIRVSVLEGDFAVMSSVGLPLSLCVQLQVSCLKLKEALWTARSTPGGFSVSLFWPAPAPEKNGCSKKRKKRKRRRAKASQVTLGSCKQSNQPATPSMLPQEDATVSPTTADQLHKLTTKSTPSPSVNKSHAPTKSAQKTPVKPSPTTVDLSKCEHVQYEARNGIHGVFYQQAESSEAGWTPVVAKRKKKVPVPQYVRRRFPPDHPIHAQSIVSDSDNDSGSDCDLGEVIPSGAVNVHYREIDGTQGLSVWTHKSRSWTPVAARTRSKQK